MAKKKTKATATAAAAPSAAKCPQHPDAKQGGRGCSAKGCTYIDVAARAVHTTAAVG